VWWVGFVCFWVFFLVVFGGGFCGFFLVGGGVFGVLVFFLGFLVWWPGFQGHV